MPQTPKQLAACIVEGQMSIEDVMNEPGDTIARFRKKPTVVSAILYNGSNHARINGFTDGRFHPVDPGDRSTDPDVTAEVLDVTHSTWVGVKDGQWIIRGVRGEFYPIDSSILAETYERLGESE